MRESRLFYVVPLAQRDGWWCFKNIFLAVFPAVLAHLGSTLGADDPRIV